MSESKLPKGVTQAQVEEWKTEYGKVKLINCIRDNGEKVQFIIVRPKRETLDAWLFALDKSDYAKAREILTNSCIMHGDKQVLSVDSNLQMTVLKRVQGFIEEVQTEEKEL